MNSFIVKSRQPNDPRKALVIQLIRNQQSASDRRRLCLGANVYDGVNLRMNIQIYTNYQPKRPTRRVDIAKCGFCLWSRSGDSSFQGIGIAHETMIKSDVYKLYLHFFFLFKCCLPLIFASWFMT